MNITTRFQSVEMIEHNMDPKFRKGVRIELRGVENTMFSPAHTTLSHDPYKHSKNHTYDGRDASTTLEAEVQLTGGDVHNYPRNDAYTCREQRQVQEHLSPGLQGDDKGAASR